MPASAQAEPVASRRVYGHSLVATCDQTGILRQIETTHYPNGEEIDVNLLLRIIKDILSDCVLVLPESSQEQKEDVTSLDPRLRSALKELSTELAYKSLNAAVDVHHVTVSFFYVLSNYAWEAKLSLMLAALVTIYGEYWVLIQSYSEEQLAKDMVTLLQLRDRVADSDEQKSCFDKLNDLIRSMVDLTECIVKMKALLSAQTSADEATILAAIKTIIIASYWIVRTVVMCTSYIHSLFGKFYGSSVGPVDIDTMTKKISDLQAACQEKTKSLWGHTFVPAKEIQIAAWGGPGGNKWTYMPEGPIKQITIVHGGVVDSISFSSLKPDGGMESPVKHGGGGGSQTAEVKIECPSKQLTGISGTYGIMEEKVYIKSLKFHTNLKEHGPFGTEGETLFSFVMEDGIIVGFHGRSGNFVDAIGVFVMQK